MKKPAIISAIALMALGLITFVCVMAVYGFDFSKLSTENLQTNLHEISDSFHSISIDTDTSNITLLPSPDGTCRVECLETDKLRHNVKVEDGTLSVTGQDHRQWFDYIGIFQKSPGLKLYLPERIYKELSIDTHTGNITLPKDFSFDSISIHATTADVSCEASATNAVEIHLTTGDLRLANTKTGTISLSSDTGDMKLEHIDCERDISITRTTGDLNMESVTCGTLSVSSDTGDAELRNVIVDGQLSIKASTGDVTFDRCDGGNITVNTTTGDVKGTLLTGKQFSGTATTGSVRLPQSTTGGQCKINTTTGDIHITVP